MYRYAYRGGGPSRGSPSAVAAAQGNGGGTVAPSPFVTECFNSGSGRQDLTYLPSFWLPFLAGTRLPVRSIARQEPSPAPDYGRGQWAVALLVPQPASAISPSTFPRSHRWPLSHIRNPLMDLSPDTSWFVIVVQRTANSTRRPWVMRRLWRHDSTAFLHHQAGFTIQRGQSSRNMGRNARCTLRPLLFPKSNLLEIALQTASGSHSARAEQEGFWKPARTS